MVTATFSVATPTCRPWLRPARDPRKVTPMNPTNPQRPASKTGDDRPGAPTFESLLGQGLRDRTLGVGGAPSLAEVAPQQLLSYASGRSPEDERAYVESVVSRSTWAYDRVVALVKASRATSQPVARSLAKRLLDGTVSGGDAAPRETVAAAVAAAILEAQGDALGASGRFAESLAKLPSSAPVARAACLIGLGRPDDARAALGKATRDTTGASADLLRRLSDTLSPTTSEDATLLAVLDSLPSLLAAS